MKTTPTFDPSLYAVVPREPTPEMAKAAAAQHQVDLVTATDMLRDAIAAAPPLPEPRDSEAVEQSQWEKIIAEMRRQLVNVLNEDEHSALDCLAALAQPQGDPLFVIFDGPPSHESGRFIEVETSDRRSVRAGEWKERDDGLWSLGPLYGVPAGAAAPATAQAGEATCLCDRYEDHGPTSELNPDCPIHGHDKIDSIRASVHDEPQPAVRGSASFGASELLPCPFCGGRATEKQWWGSDRMQTFVGCQSKSCAFSPSIVARAEHAIAEWNRRTEKPR